MHRPSLHKLAIPLLACAWLAGFARAEIEVVQISAGEQHTCALTTAGKVLCWGGFSSSLLSIPVEVRGLEGGVDSIGTGSNFSCAVTHGGGVSCWGRNDAGQLGNGTLVDSYAPVAVQGLDESVVAVSGRCGLTVSGRVLCWGAKYDVTCSGGWWSPPVCTSTPVIVPPAPAPDLSARSILENCALVSPGKLLCWAGTNATRFDVAPSGIVSATRFNHCELRGSGQVLCALDGRVTPTEAIALPGMASALVGSDYYVCALQTDGQVYCWGQGNRGGPFPWRQPTRVPVEGRAIAIASGGAHTCVITAQRGVKCWGEERLLGNGSDYFSYSRRSLPVDVTGLGGRNVNHQGLWWSAPAGSQPGWGLQVEQQGGVLFALWFTYGADGRVLWLSMPETLRRVDGSYAGAMYETTGPRFDASPWNPADVKARQAGSATFTFADDGNGIFTYEIGTARRSLPITPIRFASPMPLCAESTSTDSQNYQGLWWRSPPGLESGWGVSIAHQGDILFAIWYTYDAAGKGRWLSVSRAEMSGPGRYTGTIYESRGPAFDAEPWDAHAVTLSAVGSATFSFSDPDNGVFAYTLDGVSQVKPITRMIYERPRTVCRS